MRARARDDRLTPRYIISERSPPRGIYRELNTPGEHVFPDVYGRYVSGINSTARFPSARRGLLRTRFVARGERASYHLIANVEICLPSGRPVTFILTEYKLLIENSEEDNTSTRIFSKNFTLQNDRI